MMSRNKILNFEVQNVYHACVDIALGHWIRTIRDRLQAQYTSNFLSSLGEVHRSFMLFEFQSEQPSLPFAVSERPNKAAAGLTFS